MSISTPLLSTRSSISNTFPHNVKETVRRICPQVIEIFEPPKEGYQPTLKLDFSKIPRKKGNLSNTCSVCWDSKSSDCFYSCRCRENNHRNFIGASCNTKLSA